MSIKAGDQRLRPDAFATVIEPKRRFARHQRQAMAFEMRKGMRNAGGVVPHLAGMRDLSADRIGGVVVQLPIRKRMRAVEHRRRQRPPSHPIRTGFLMAAIDAAHRQHRQRRGDADLGAGLLVDGHHARHDARSVIEADDAVTMQHGQPAAFVGGAHCIDHQPREPLRCSPDDVIARQRIAVALQAALDPVHRRHEGHAMRQQPVIDLGTRVLDVIARPLQRPVLGRVEFAEPDPVAQRDLRRVGDLHPRLQRGADQRHTAERPQRQPAEPLRCVAIQQGHRLAAPHRLQRRDDAGETAADDDYIGLNGRAHVTARSCA